MKLVTFNPFRTIGIPKVTYVKPERMFNEIETIKSADVLLFPEHWQVNALVYGLKKAIFPSIQSIHLGYSKVEMTRALRVVCPGHVPYTEIAANTEEHVERLLDLFPFPFVAKEIRNSMGNGVFLIENEAQFRSYAERNEVLYVQEYLPSTKDLRVCFVGDEIIGAYWRVGSGGDFRNNVARGGYVSAERIPDDALDLVAGVARALGIDHAGFDILYHQGKPYILEFNTLFGNQGLLQNGVSVERKIYEYLRKTFSPPYPTSPIAPSLEKRIS